MTGHPDDQSYASWRGPLLGSATAAHIDSTHPITVQGYVTNFASIFLFLSNINPVGLQVQVVFFVDATQAQLCGSTAWTIRQGGGLSCYTPALGNFVVITLSTNDATGGTILYTFAPSNTPCSSARYNSSGALVEQFNQSIAANTTSNFSLQTVAEGPASVYFNDLAASTHLSFGVITVSDSGVRTGRILFVAAPATVFNGVLYVPRGPIAVQVVNNDGAAAHSFDASLVVDGR